MWFTKSVWRSILGGLVGFALAWGGWHCWLDHRNLHVLVEFVVQQQANAGRAPIPPAPPK